jgi:hypothetical protein
MGSPTLRGNELKRLIICCVGNWNGTGHVVDDQTFPTNVESLACRVAKCDGNINRSNDRGIALLTRHVRGETDVDRGNDPTASAARRKGAVGFGCEVHAEGVASVCWPGKRCESRAVRKPAVTSLICRRASRFDHQTEIRTRQC